MYKAFGISEISVFRGVTSGVKGSDLGASWTTDPGVAISFGTVVETKVPVESIFASPVVFKDFSQDSSFGESEVVLLGSSDFVGKVLELDA